MRMKPKVSVIIPTLGRETLYPLIKELLKQKTNFDYEIVLIPQVELKSLPKDKRIKVYPEELGKGFAYYRNIGIKNSQGDILAFIDDDEMPKNDLWLNYLTEPIIKNKEKAATAGVSIKLGEGYFTDSISLLGFPGGRAIGFRTMWHVDNNDYTQHLCSGNLAISKKVINKVGNFSSNFKHGNEDVNLADKLIENKIRIKYKEEATVYHIARKGLNNFIKWNILRGRSAASYLKSQQEQKNGKVGNRFASSTRILTKLIRENPIYLPGAIFMMLNQYAWQTIGYLIEK